MSRRFLAPAALALFLAACHNAAAGPAFRLNQPSSVAVFWGISHKNPGGLHPYVAVANTASDELVLFDPVDDVVVASPVLIRPLSIPVPDARPALVAAARFTASDGNSHSDLLVAVSQGATSLQLVRTWANADPSQPQEVDPGLATDAPVELGSQVMAMVAIPEVDGSGGVVPDRAWVIASLVDGRLSVVEYQLLLTVTGTGTTEEISAVTGVPIYQSPGFHALSLAVDPSMSAEGTMKAPYLYAATVDLIPPSEVQGVGQFDLRGAPGAFGLSALDAHAPTRLVAAFTLRERNLDTSGGYDQVTDVTSAGVNAFQAAEVSRVYAYIDPGFCGPTTDVLCGVAVLDPVAGDLLEDPWHTGQVPKQYLRPIAIPAVPTALVVGKPPRYAPSTATTGFENDPYMYITAAGNRLTTGVLLIPSDDGRSYYADLARWEVPSNSFELFFGHGQQTQVSTFRPSNTDLPEILLFRPPELEKDQNGNDLGFPAFYTTSSASAFIRLTPGYTTADVFSVTYQGTLPDFANKHVAKIEVVGGTGAATEYRLALQSDTGTLVVNVYDPAHGVRVGDIVDFWTSKSLPTGNVCPDTPSSAADSIIAPIDGKILEIDKPDADHPGGSLLVSIGDCVPVLVGASTVCDSDTHGPWNSMGPTDTSQGCWASLNGQAVPVTIRAQGGAAGMEEFVVAGARTGYAGRATTVTSSVGFPQFSFTNDGEADLVAACPLIPYPSDLTRFPAITCDDACRLTCEAAAIARRARRHHLTSAVCYATDSQCYWNYFKEFSAPASGPPSGPVLAFSVGWQTSAAPTLRFLLVRDTQVAFNTHSGYSPASLFGAGVNGGPGTHPMDAAYFDRTQDQNWDRAGDGYRFFVPYVNNTVLDVTPSQSNAGVKVLR